MDNLDATYGKVKGMWVDYDASHDINDYIDPELPESCVYVGKITDDGLEVAALATQGDAVYAADGSRVLTLDGDLEGDLTVSLLAVDSFEANKAVYGDSQVIKTANGVALALTGAAAPVRRIIFQILKASGRIDRIVVMRGQVVQSDAQNYNYNEVTSLPLTISPSADPITGTYIYRYPVVGAQGGESQVAITVSSTGDGEVNLPGINMVDRGTDLTLTAEPGTDSEVDYWEVNGVNTKINSDTVTFSRVFDSQAVKCVFKLKD